MVLRAYNAKRNFRRTPEPRSDVPRRVSWSYVVQKHAASHLHYDFRLELDGVLKSWAVPKGPSLDPSQRRLAVHVEDHPVAYGKFEGVIPKGEYGGGTVMLWDRGTWEPIGDPHTSYQHGKLKFRLNGQKLHGEWVLVRLSGSAGDRDHSKDWFLIKRHDEAARSVEEFDITVAEPVSVKSGRNLEEIGAGKSSIWKANKAARGSKQESIAPPRKTQSAQRKSESANTQGRAAPMPRRIDPQLATLVKDAPDGDRWLHEIKFDGYRMLCRVAGGRAQFVSRNQKDWTTEFGHLATAAESLPIQQALFDGEVVALNPNGTTDFQTLQNVFREGRSSELIYFVFDLLHLNGTDLRGIPLEERKRLLLEITGPSMNAPIRYTDHVLGNGPEFFQEARKLGLEGIISKRRDRPHVPGRGFDWLKIKCIQSAEFVIGGFTDPGARDGFGALLLGHYESGSDLKYAGKVGTGFSQELLGALRKRLNRLRQSESPFTDLRGAAGDARGAHWVRPQLVAQVAFSNWTRGGHIRHSAFLGLREDKPASTVVRETAVEPHEVRTSRQRPPKKLPHRNRKLKLSATSNYRSMKGAAISTSSPLGIRLTNPEKVLYPDAGITKLELAQYYFRVAQWLLPHAVNRPLALVRCPDGIEHECFFQKHPGIGTPDRLRTIAIKEKNSKRNYVVLRDATDLVSLAQIGVLELHVWGSRADKLELPDRMILDLDPDPSVSWSRVVESGHQIREFLDDIGLVSFVKTTGGKGLHIVVPLERRIEWDQLKAFAKLISEQIVRADPGRYTSNMSKAVRGTKIFLDYLRNGRGATAIAPYSPRKRPGAPVSVPLSWDELTPEIHSDQFTIRNLAERFASAPDPWKGMHSVRQSITDKVRQRVESMG